jgi:uncharacterized membrane protein
VNLLSFFTGRKKSFFSKEDEERMVQAIRFAEKQTSGEVRLYIESNCSYINPIDRAKELFAELNMHKTKDQNGVLLYFAMKDRQMAIWGDEGMIHDVGDALKTHFPYASDDKNELDDNIVFGK